MNDFIYSFVEFLGQPLVITFFIAIIFFFFMFRITGAEKIWNEKKLEAQKDNLETEKIILERKKIAKELEKEEPKQEDNKTEPNVIYIKENNNSDNTSIIILLVLLLLISLYFNYQQYQEIQQYKQIMGEIKNGISIFQEFLK